jgi:hypothetical protein
VSERDGIGVRAPATLIIAHGISIILKPKRENMLHGPFRDEPLGMGRFKLMINVRTKSVR